MPRRLPSPLIRHLFAEARAGRPSAAEAAAELGISRSRFYQLRTDYLRACASERLQHWEPRVSGGDHHPDWPAQTVALATRLLSSSPRSSYSAVASELLRRLGFKTDRASVRRWALAHQLAPDTRYKKPAKPVRRWQASDFGALWQYDATPHAWLPGQPQKQVLLDILDDATRTNTGARLYPAETLLAHFDFLSRVFLAHGLPLALYVDYHSFFFTHTPDSFTQLGEALHFYGIALRYAPTPQAKGKIERRHDYWQKRLPPLLAADQILTLESANALLDQLLPPFDRLRAFGTPTPTKSTANSAPLPTPHARRPSPKIAPNSAPLQPARGGVSSGASAPPFASATTAEPPSATSASPWTLRHAPASSTASSQTVTSSSSNLLPPKTPSLSSSFIPRSFDPSFLLSSFVRTHNSSFECYTTLLLLILLLILIPIRGSFTLETEDQDQEQEHDHEFRIGIRQFSNRLLNSQA